MEFNFIIQKDFPIDNEGFLTIEGSQLPPYYGPITNFNKKGPDIPNFDKTAKLAQILNRMGEASAKVN